MSFTTTRFIPMLMVGALLAAPSQAQCPTGDDTFEDNDDCYTAATVPTGLTSGLVLYGAAGGSTLDLDWFTLGATQLLNGEAIRIEVIVTNGVSNVDVDLYRDDLQIPAACDSATDGGTTAGSTTNFGSANPIHNYTNTSGLDQYVSWRVDPYPSTTSLDCAEYDMIVTIIPAPCSGPDDVYEDNDTCATAVAFPPSGTVGLQVHGPLYATGQDFDYWSTTVAAGDRIEIDLTFTDSVENIDAFLYDVSLGCPGVQLDSGTTTSSNESLVWDNTTGVAVPVVLEVIAGDTANSCNEYVLDYTTYLSPCGQPDDSLEDNDTCATAGPLPLGSTTGLWVFGDSCTPDDDFYTISVPNGDRLSVDIFFSDVIGDIDLYAYAVVGCPGLQVESSVTTTDNESLYYDNLTGGPLNVVIEVRADLSTFESNTYDMTVAMGVSPCASDDTFEPNDSCAAAVPITPGSYTGLKHFYNNGSSINDDWYTIDVQPLDTLVTELYLIALNGDLDADYYDITGGCPGTIEGSTTGLNSDHVTHSWVNDTGAVATVAIRIDRYSDTFLCQDYDMDITIVPNTCIGDDSFEENDDCFTAALLPTGTTTGLRYYYNGSTTNDDEDWYELAIPAGSDVTLTLTHTSANGAMDIDMYQDCGTGSGSNIIGTQTGTSTDVVTLTASNWGAATNWWLRVDRQTGTWICNDYDLTFTTVPSTNPCIGTDDVYEDNDICDDAVLITQGTYTGLRMIAPGGSTTGEDLDYYKFTIPAGESATVTLTHVSADLELDIDIYDITGGCPGVSDCCATGMGGDVVFQDLDNTTGAPQTIAFVVDVWTSGGLDCVDYTLDLVVTGTPLATPFCFGDGSEGTCPGGNNSVVGAEEGCVNGSGVGAKITVAGVPSVSADSLVLSVEQAIPNEFGIFVQNLGVQTPALPFYNGLLCLNTDAHLVRHYAPPAIQPTVTNGSGTGTNAQAMTLGDYLNDTQPGVTMYYQFWGRDNSGPAGFGANFSSGVHLVWLP